MQPARKLDEDLHPAALAGAVSQRETGTSISAGSSPALDLQRRLETAVLRGLYAEPEIEPERWAFPTRVAVISVAAAGTWLLVFGIGSQLFG